MASLSDQSVVVGGGLAGISAANTVLENGGGVFLLDKFTSDTLKGGAKKFELAKVNLNLSLVARLGGHSAPRTHRDRERFPGMTLGKANVWKIGNVLLSTHSQTLNV